MSLATTPRSLADLALPAPAKPLRQACAVHLVDRRTGLTQRVNGSPLALFTKDPAEAVAELLSGSDAKVWEARIEPIAGAA